MVRKSGTLSVSNEVLENSFSISPNPSFNHPKIKSTSNNLINSIQIPATKSILAAKSIVATKLLLAT